MAMSLHGFIHSSVVVEIHWLCCIILQHLEQHISVVELGEHCKKDIGGKDQ